MIASHHRVRAADKTWRGEYGRTVAGQVTVRRAEPRGSLTVAQRRRRAFSGEF